MGGPTRALPVVVLHVLFLARRLGLLPTGAGKPVALVHHRAPVAESRAMLELGLGGPVTKYWPISLRSQP